MKKRISLLLCTLIMILSLAGCSGKSDEGTGYDLIQLQEMSEFIITTFASMEAEELDQFEALSEYQLNYTMLQSGLSIEANDFLGLIGSWEAAEIECGEYIGHGDYEVEIKGDGVIVSTLAQYEEREAVIAFSFDEKSFIKSMDVSAQFSIGEILTKAGLNTLLGMGTVFSVLVFLAFLISLLKYVPMILDKLSKKPEAQTPVQAPKAAPVVEAPVVEETDDLELIAVITAAIAAQEGTSTDGFVVRSIRRRPSNHWN